MKLRAAVFLTLFTLVVASSACSRQEAGEPGADEGRTTDGGTATAPGTEEEGAISLGFLGSFEGPATILSEQALVGAEIAVDMLNEQGGVNGREVNLVVRDSTGRPEVMSTNAQELIDREGVVALVGGGASTETLAASEVSRSLETPFLVALGNSEAITVEEGHDWIFQLQPTGGMEGRGVANYAVEQEWKTIQMLAPDYEWGHSVTEILDDTVTSAFDDADVSDPLFFTLGESDFSSYLARLSGGDADVFVSYAWGGDAVSMTRQAEAYGLLEDRTVFGMWTLDVLQALGEDAPEGVIGLDRAPFFHLTDEHELAASLTEEFQAREGEFPGGFAFQAFDAVMAWAAAAEQAASTDSESVRAALHEVEFESTRGTISFTDLDNQATVPVYIGTIAFTDDYDFAIFEDVVEISPESTMITEEEFESRRG